MHCGMCYLSTLEKMQCCEDAASLCKRGITQGKGCSATGKGCRITAVYWGSLRVREQKDKVPLPGVRQR